MKRNCLTLGILLLLSSVISAQKVIKNKVVFHNVRFSFITESLVRIEFANEAKFVDEPTLFARNREAGFENIKVEDKKNNHYTISTPKMRLDFFDNGFPIGQTNLNVYFTMDGKQKSWYIASEQSKNLLGAINTLDGISGEVPRHEGLLSRDGWYLIKDTGKEILKNGWASRRNDGSIQDFYLFIYGHDYKSALKSLQQISGAVPMTRKYVHGAWYCRWWNYTSDEYKDIVKGYKEHDFPLDIIVFDMGWHKQNATVGTGHAGTNGWTGYSWNRKLIPNPKALIKEFKDENINVVLNEHPHDGIRDNEDMYPEFMKAMNAKPGVKNIIFDAGNQKYMTNFMKYAHQESDSMGVAFWWLDWQQDYLYPVVRGTNMKHLPWLNHIYYDYSANNGQNLRGAGYSRWAGWGDHRNPIQFSGDAVGCWPLLKFEVDLTTTSGNEGCFFWAHDIGGFYDGKDPVLYTRWTQFALLNSSLRIHSVYDKDLDRRPWLWGDMAEKSMRIVYHMRSQMMPYIYSSVWQCHTDMLPLNRGMYIEYPEEEESYHNPQQFLFGDLLLGAPITSPNDENGFGSQKVWLPKGNTWYNIFTSKSYEGGRTIKEKCDINSFPLYIKGGYPIPLQPYTPRMSSTPLNQLIVRCYPGAEGANNSFTLYEDDGLTKKYENGQYATTKLEYKKKDGQTSIIVNATEGKYDGQVEKRSYRFELIAIKDMKNLKVNGHKAKAVYNETIKGYVVNVKAKKLDKKIILTFK